MVLETEVQSQVESYQRLKKWYMISLCLILSTIRWGSKLKYSNPRNGVAPSPTPRRRSYWIGEQPSISAHIYIPDSIYELFINNEEDWFFFVKHHPFSTSQLSKEGRTPTKIVLFWVWQWTACGGEATVLEFKEMLYIISLQALTGYSD